MNENINKLHRCLKIAVDSLIAIANNDANIVTKTRAKDTIIEIKKIFNNK